MNNLINEENNKEDKNGIIMAIPALMFFPIIFCYYGFLIWLIQKKNNYGLDISVSDINFKIAIYSGIILNILVLFLRILKKIFSQFENSTLENIGFIFVMILAYILVGSCFAILFLINI